MKSGMDLGSVYLAYNALPYHSPAHCELYHYLVTANSRPKSIYKYSMIISPNNKQRPQKIQVHFYGRPSGRLIHGHKSIREASSGKRK